MTKTKASGRGMRRPRRQLPKAPKARVQAARAPADGRDRPTLVAVGASAGGLEAFSQLLQHLDGAAANLAFVFVQHLSPQHASALVELLGPKTRFAVEQVADGVAIEPNRVYVIPPNAHMEVADWRLHLLPRPTDQTQFTPIDVFLQSVARSVQDRAIAVILSGTASDGAIGIREIKEAGGIVIVQRPDSARHDGMPRAAIATGMVDLVLTPAEIGEHLSHAPAHPYLNRSENESAEPPITDTQLGAALAILRRTSSIDFKQYKMPTVRRRLLRRMAVLRLADPDAYLRYLSAHTTEAQALSQDLLIHVTRFFRDPESFAALGRVLDELVRGQAGGPIRIWIPGCATGEEAYSVAICVLEALGDRAPELRVQIFATDASDTAIEQARGGTYPTSIGADVSPSRLKRFFTRTDGGYRVVEGPA